MPTRFYYPSSWSSVKSTAYTAIWSRQTGVSRQGLLTWKPNDGYAVHSCSEYTTNGSAYNHIARQYISCPISGSFYINGQIYGILQARESSTSQNAYSAMRVFVVDSSMAVRGTLYTSGNSGTGAAEFASSRTNHDFPPYSTMTSVTAQNGDRVVVEVGYFPRNVTTTAYYAQFWFGTPDTDCASNTTDTSSYAPWIEFEDVDLMFQGNKVIDDNVGIIDTHQYKFETVLKKIVVEAVSIAENILRSRALSRIVSEAVQICKGGKVTDDFNRADESPLAGNWTAVQNQSANTLVISSNQVTTGGASGATKYRRNEGSYDGDQYSQVKIVAGLGSNYVAVIAKTTGSEGTLNCYDAYTNGTANALGKIVNGTFSANQNPTATFVAGDTIGIAVLDIDGVQTIRMYHNGSQIGTDWQDNSFTTGTPGMGITGGTTCQIDDWEGGAPIGGLEALYKLLTSIKKIIIDSMSIAENVASKITTTAALIKKIIVEAVALTETNLRSAKWNRIVIDPIALTDRSTRFRKYMRSIVEALGISDESTRASKVLRTLVDAISIADKSSGLHKMIRTLVDAIAIADMSLRSISTSVKKILVESVSITENVNKSVAASLKKIVVESIAITENAKTVFGTLIKKIIVEVVSASENTLRSFRRVRTLIESLSITDKDLRSIFRVRTIIDAMNITDKSTRKSILRRIIIDAMTITESVVVFLYSGLLKKIVIEAIGIADKDLRSIKFRRIVGESMAMIELNIAARKMKRLIGEVMSITAADARIKKMVRRLVEAIAITDKNIGKIIHKLKRIVVESIGITDKVKGLVQYAIPDALHNRLRTFTANSVVSVAKAGSAFVKFTAKIKNDILKGGN